MQRSMFQHLIKSSNTRLIATTSNLLHRVTVIGANGGVGKILSLLLKTNPLVTDLALMDIKNTDGITKDLSFIDTFSGVQSFSGIENTAKSLECSKIVVVAAGVSHTGDASSDAVFDANKDLIYNVASLKAKVCPDAFLAILTNPLNALIPLAAETLKQANVHDRKKLFGISNLDAMRARTLIGDYLVIDGRKVTVDVIGGHSDTTTVPMLSAASPSLTGDRDEWKHIYDQVRQTSTAVLKASGGKQSCQLAIAYAASLFCGSLLKALEGKFGIFDVAYVESDILPEVKFFSSNFEINKDGIRRFNTLPDMSDYESGLLQKAIPELQKSIEKGIKYAQTKKDQK